MGSSRLPGKILMDIGAMPAIALELRRIGQASVDTVVVATSDGPIDDPVAELAHSLGVSVVRGSEHDVLGRFVQALNEFPADIVIRTTGDCPFFDPAILDAMLKTFRSSGADYCSNTLIRTFPVGLDCEIMTADAIRVADAQAQDPVEREHVTPYIYRRPENFKLIQHTCAEALGRERWTLDTPEDLVRLQHMATLVEDVTSVSWHDLLSVVGTTEVLAPLDILPRIDDPDPAVRRWSVVKLGQQIGSAMVTTVGGDGTLKLAVPAELRSSVLELVRTALLSDRQVRVLHVADVLD